MASNQPLQDLFEKNRYDNNIHKKSKTWFDQQIVLLTKKRITPNSILRNDPSALKNQVAPGNLYMFFYDAKMKDSLPYWDKFPLVFPFRKVEGGFYGLNLHYLPYKMRAQLMDKLMSLKSNSNLNDNTKLRLSWDLLNGASKFAAAKPCVKHYLNDHLRSPLIRIDPTDWSTALMLPVERFVGASTGKVWADSQRAI